jgi:hypothetical protein
VHIKLLLTASPTFPVALCAYSFRVSHMPPKPARIRLALTDGTFADGEFPEETPLVDVLSHFEKLESERPEAQRRHFSAYRGVPPVEIIGGGDGKKPIAEIHTNMIGDMLPSLELGGRRAATASELASTTLKDLGATNRVPSKIQLSHKYVRPILSPEDQQKAVDNLRARLAQALGGGPAPQQHRAQAGPAAVPTATATKAGISVSARARRPPIPEGRATKVAWTRPAPALTTVSTFKPTAPAPAPAHAPAAVPAATAAAAPAVPAAATVAACTPAGGATHGDRDSDDNGDDDSDGFYEVTEEDSRLLEESIRARASAEPLDDDELVAVRITVPPPPSVPAAAAALAPMTDSHSSSASETAWADGDLTVDAVFRASEPVERVYAHMASLFLVKAPGFHVLPADPADEAPALTVMEAAAEAVKRQKRHALKQQQQGARVEVIEDMEEEAADSAAAAAAAASSSSLTSASVVAGAGVGAGAEEEEEEEHESGFIGAQGASGMDRSRNSKLLREYPFYLFRTPPFDRLKMGSVSLREAHFKRTNRLHLGWLQTPDVHGWAELIKPQ